MDWMDTSDVGLLCFSRHSAITTHFVCNSTDTVSIDILRLCVLLLSLAAVRLVSASSIEFPVLLSLTK